jgi:diadenosine tetraphosphatase ApaH/serine/threonine PP2A family protein phosphatase
MLVAVLSDIHGNRHAFEAALDDVARTDVEEVWCLGDLVGYGAEPDACVDLARERCDLVLCGNHDLAVIGDLSIEDFSKNAAAAARWTMDALSEDRKAWLRGLEPAADREGVGLYHGSPRDPVWEYVLSGLLADLCLDAVRFRVVLVGHSHVAVHFDRADSGSARAIRRHHGDTADLGVGEHLLNPGSVGQPRDGDPRAAWLLLDTDAATAQWRRTAYDLAGAQAAIRAAGLPGALAERLEYGQ